MDFKDKVVLITGAAGGIGKAATQLFHEKGALLVLVDLNESALKKMADELDLVDYLLVSADVTQEKEVINYTDAAVSKYGKIDIFLNNAGIIGELAEITDVTSDNFNKVMDINLKAVFYGLKYVLRVMKEQKTGNIVNTSSVAGLNGSAGLGSYSASKHAVIGLTKTAAAEVASNNIRVNAVCPAPVDTELMANLDNIKSPSEPIKARNKYEEKIPLNRYAEPKEIAEVILFLASEQSSYITGCALPVDGGYTSIY